MFQPKARGPGFPGFIKGGVSAAAVRIIGGRGTVGNFGGAIGAGAAIGVYLGAGGYVDSGNFPTLSLKGIISGIQYGVLAKGGPTTIANTGVVIGGTAAVMLPAGYANRVVLFPAGSFIGKVDGGNAVGAPVGSTLQLSGYGNNSTATVAGMGGVITNFSTISFGFQDLWSVNGDTAGIAGGEVFQNFAAGDVLNITGVTGETIVGFNANTLSLGGTAPLNVIIKPSDATAANFQVYNDPVNGIDIITNLASLPCFVVGTRIRTERGEIAVERLREGDEVVSALNGGTTPVVWIGRRRVRPRQHPRPETIQPVIIQPGAFGPGSPDRSLRLSPEHAVFVDGVLIPVGLLINGREIVQEDVVEVTYFHVQLPEHDVLYAEGLTCESYLATGDGAAFDNTEGAVALHPAFAPAVVWETSGCAPLIIRGVLLDAARARLRTSAGSLPEIIRVA